MHDNTLNQRQSKIMQVQSITNNAQPRAQEHAQPRAKQNNASSIKTLNQEHNNSFNQEQRKITKV